MLQLWALNCLGNKRGLWFSMTSSQTWRYKHPGVAWCMLLVLTPSFSMLLVHERLELDPGWWGITVPRGEVLAFTHATSIWWKFSAEIAFRNKRLNCVLSVLKTQVRYHLVLVFDCVWQSSWGCVVCVCFLSLYSAQHVCVLLEANYYDGGFSGFWHQPGYELRAPLICFHLGHGRTARWE